MKLTTNQTNHALHLDTLNVKASQHHQLSPPILDHADVSPATQMYQNFSPVKSKSLDLLNHIESTLSAEEKLLYQQQFDRGIQSNGEDGIYSAWLAVKQTVIKEQEMRKNKIR